MAAPMLSALAKWKISSNSWASEGGTGGLVFLDFEIWHFSVVCLAKKGRFRSFDKKKWKFTTFWAPLGKIFMDTSGKNPQIASSPGKILPTPMFLITVDVGADFSRSNWMISNLQPDRVASTSDESWNTFRLCRSDSDHLTRLFFNSPV